MLKFSVEKLKSDSIYILLLALLIGIAFNYFLLKDLKQLPSPIFGGDFWNHLASIYHMYYGGSFFESGELLGEIPWVPRVFHALVLIQAVALNIDPLISLINISHLLYAIGIISIYFLTRKENSQLGILFVGLLMLCSFPIFKYTDFSVYVFSFLVFVSYYNFIKEENLKNAIILGLVCGIGTLTNIQLAVSIALIFVVHFLSRLYPISREGHAKILEFFKTGTVKNVIIAGAIAFLFFMTYYYQPIFVYHLHAENPTYIYGWADFSDLSISINYVFSDILLSYITSPSMFIYILGFALALFLYFKTEDEKLKNAFFVFFVAMLIALFHHLITFPLFNVHFAPERMFLIFFTLLSYAGFFYFKFEGKYAKFTILFLLLALSASMAYRATAFTSSGYYNMAVMQLDKIVSEPSDWIKSNTNVNDVFLSDNENSFAYNSLTGRKFVTYRRTHTSLYADINQRNLDASIILYGKNDALRKQLLSKYNVKYVVWNVYWLQNNLIVNEDGTISHFFDPYMLPYSAEAEKQLKDNGVPYAPIVYYLDPAYLATYPQYKILVIIPYQDHFHPWDLSFDKYLQEVYSYESNGMETVKIFKVEYNE